MQRTDRSPRLVERRVRRLRPHVAVPAAVGPLPSDKRLSQQADPRVGCQPQICADRERVALLRGATPCPARDNGDPGPVRRAGEPSQDAVNQRQQPSVLGSNAEVHQRHQPPVGACPLLVWVASQHVGGGVAAEQSLDERAWRIAVLRASEELTGG
jgi:hypothetical protein